MRASRASPVGSADPTTTTWSAAATASRVSWLRDSGRPRSASSSRLNPVSTTTSPTSAARSRTASSTPGRASTQRSGRGRPVSTSKRSATTRRHRANDSASRDPALTSRAAASRPETSSSTPRCWATAPPCGIGVDQHARVAAMGVLGGEPDRERRTAWGAGGTVHGDQPTAAPRPAAGPGSGTGSGSTTSSRVPGRDARPRAAAPSSAHGTTATTPIRASASGRATDRHAAHVVAQQLHHRVGVEAAELAGHHRDVGLPRGRAGQQVGEVDAPLEHHERRRRRAGRSAAASHGSPPAASSTATRSAIGSALPRDDDATVGDAAQRRAELVGALGRHPDDHLAGRLRRQAVRAARARRPRRRR